MSSRYPRDYIFWSCCLPSPSQGNPQMVGLCTPPHPTLKPQPLAFNSHFLPDARSKVNSVLPYPANVGPRGSPGTGPMPSPRFCPLSLLCHFSPCTLLPAAGSLLGTSSSAMGLTWGLGVLFLLHVCGSSRIPGESV